MLAYLLYGSLFIEYESAHQMVRGSLESLQLASIFSTYPAAALSVWQAALVEVMITSILMGMIMALTDDGNGVPKGPLAPLLIGILVAVIGASTGPLTGFAMNPARDFGPKLFARMAGWGDVAMTGGAISLISSCRLWHPSSAPVRAQQFIVILLAKIYRVIRVSWRKTRASFTKDVYY